MDRRSQSITINVADAAKLRAGVCWRSEPSFRISNILDRTTEKARYAKLNVRKNAGIVAAGVVPPIRQNCRTHEVSLESRLGQASHQVRE